MLSFAYHPRFNFNVNVVLHASSDLTQNRSANKGIRAAPSPDAKNLVHLRHRRYWGLCSILVHFSQRVCSRLHRKEVRIDCIISLEVILYLNKCHQVTFSYK